MATLKEVAALAGVSQAAVSRFLNNDPRLSLPDSTRQRILDAVNELGYVKKARKNKDPRRIGILHWYSLEQELADPYYLSIRSGIEEYCAREQLQIIRMFKADA
ncbi:LacI family DNA-binding transcriptional regulator, partial [Faecalibaculum rodentium]